jgi:hypothetical protein
LYQEYVIPVRPAATKVNVTDPPELIFCEVGCFENLNMSGPDNGNLIFRQNNLITLLNQIIS